MQSPASTTRAGTTPVSVSDRAAYHLKAHSRISPLPPPLLGPLPAPPFSSVTSSSRPPPCSSSSSFSAPSLSMHSSTQPIQPSTPNKVNTPKGEKVGKPRQGAFSSAECIGITRAMVHAKNDPITGSGQKLDEYHAKFLSYFVSHKQDSWPERSLPSLVCKFAEIKRDCGKFVSCLKLAQDLPKSSGETRQFRLITFNLHSPLEIVNSHFRIQQALKLMM